MNLDTLIIRNSQNNHPDVMEQMKAIVNKVFPIGTPVPYEVSKKYQPQDAFSLGTQYEWDMQLREYIAVDLYRFWVLWHRMSADEAILTIVKSLELIGISNINIMRLFEEFYNTKIVDTLPEKS